MQLDSARELKESLLDTLVATLSERPSIRALGVPAGPFSENGMPPRTVAIGLAPKGDGQYQLAVRLQRRALEFSGLVDSIRKKAKGEVEVRYIGRVSKRAAVPWQQKRVRPLRLGSSVGHFKITAGTLGAFVRSRLGGEPLILSNNHVLANENQAKAGDAILQPGKLDGGQLAHDRVGSLAGFIKLRRTSANRIDAATASIEAGIEINAAKLAPFGRLHGVGPTFLDEGAEVRKVGRTTGATKGRVTAIELDHLIVGYDVGDLRFDGQIEIEGNGTKAFSDGGDSGSLIVNPNGLAVALLFAGTSDGGSNGRGLTYANPIHAVLDALKVELVF